MYGCSTETHALSDPKQLLSPKVPNWDEFSQSSLGRQADDDKLYASNFGSPVSKKKASKHPRKVHLNIYYFKKNPTSGKLTD